MPPLPSPLPLRCRRNLGLRLIQLFQVYLSNRYPEEFSAPSRSRLTKKSLAQLYVLNSQLSPVTVKKILEGQPLTGRERRGLHWALKHLWIGCNELDVDLEVKALVAMGIDHTYAASVQRRSPRRSLRVRHILEMFRRRIRQSKGIVRQVFQARYYLLKGEVDRLSAKWDKRELWPKLRMRALVHNQRAEQLADKLRGAESVLGDSEVKVSLSVPGISRNSKLNQFLIAASIGSREEMISALRKIVAIPEPEELYIVRNEVANHHEFRDAIRKAGLLLNLPPVVRGFLDSL